MLSQFVGEHELAVLGTPNIGPNGTIVTNTIYGMGDDDLLQLPRINRNQITVGKFIGKYSMVNFSPNSPRPGNCYGITFLRLMWLKVLPNQLKIFVNLTFSPKV